MVMHLRRRPDWRVQLAMYLALEQDRVFSWGKSDCALFAAGAVDAMTGVDLARELRGTYTSAEQAKDVLRSMGCSTVADLADLHLPRIDRPSHAMPGDIVLIEEGPLGALGVSVGQAIRVRGRDVLGTLPLLSAAIAWRVG